MSFDMPILGLVRAPSRNKRSGVSITQDVVCEGFDGVLFEIVLRNFFQLMPFTLTRRRGSVRLLVILHLIYFSFMTYRAWIHGGTQPVFLCHLP